jgi:hypothetical protein
MYSIEYSNEFYIPLIKKSTVYNKKQIHLTFHKTAIKGLINYIWRCRQSVYTVSINISIIGELSFFIYLFNKDLSNVQLPL